MIKTRNQKRKLETVDNSSNKKQKVSVDTMPEYIKCQCGGGQSCLVDRRWMGDWVHEDEVFRENNLPIRVSCFDPFSPQQEAALYRVMNPNYQE